MEKERGSESLTDVICVSPKAAEMDRLNILKILLRAGEKAYGRRKLGRISSYFHYHKGPYIKDVRKISWILDPLPPFSAFWLDL